MLCGLETVFGAPQPRFMEGECSGLNVALWCAMVHNRSPRPLHLPDFRQPNLVMYSALAHEAERQLLTATVQEQYVFYF